LEYHNVDKWLYSANDPSTKCTNLVNLGSVTPEIMVTNAPFQMRWQKSAYPTKYLINCWTNLHQVPSIGSGVYGGYKTDKFHGSPRDVAIVTN